MKLSVLASAGIGLYSLDDNIQKWSISSSTQTSSDISSVFEKLGNTSSTSAALGVTLITGLVLKSKKTQNVSLLALKASLLSGLLAQTFKNIGHRRRPNSGAHKNVWEGPEIGGKHRAFPSGHTTTAFALATTFSQLYKDKKWVGITSYTMASLAGFSRIHDNKHWATDVFAGAVLGYFSAKTIVRNEHRNNRQIVFRPDFQFGTTVLTVVIRLD